MTTFLSFYLPQYHPIPENDKWWGKGFTEWTSVAAARPRFRGHHQPQIPSDLGFYDLRLSETRVAQADLARVHGIGGFCYYHYWFSGKQLLGRPLLEVLAEGKPEFPFCLCWANENWTRAWDGLDREVLVRQEYAHTDAVEHFATLLKYFNDDRYITVEGRPLFLIYRYDQIPDPMRYLEAWREMARAAGLPGLYLCAVINGFITSSEQMAIRAGFDAVVDFQPNRRDFPIHNSWSQRIVRTARAVLPGRTYQWLKLNTSMVNRVNYRSLVEKKLRESWPTDYIRYPCVFPSWDNTARRQTPTVVQNDSPADYGRWLRHAARLVAPYSSQQRLVFINAWNEWAEGCHLEPDRHWGTAFLEETKSVVSETVSVRDSLAVG